MLAPGYWSLMLAMILGVPMGTVVAQLTSWRMAFWLICAVGVVAWSAMWFCIPRDRDGVVTRYRLTRTTGSYYLDANACETAARTVPCQPAPTLKPIIMKRMWTSITQWPARRERQSGNGPQAATSASSTTAASSAMTVMSDSPLIAAASPADSPCVPIRTEPDITSR